MSTTLIGASPTRVTTVPEFVLGTTVIIGPFTYTYAKAAATVAIGAAFGLTEDFATDAAEVPTTHDNGTGQALAANDYFWARGQNLGL